MKNLQLLLASALPMEMITETLGEALQEHKLLNTEESKMKLGGACALFITKVEIDRTKGGVDKLMETLDKMEKGVKLLTPSES